MSTSQNGYTANNPALVSSRLVPGTTRKLRVRNGPAGDLLLWVASQFDTLVEDIEQGVLDDWGYAERTIRGSSTELSNHSSGTAIDLNATAHPLGTQPTANYSATEVARIREIVARTEGCVRWGGDYTGRRDGMHFEIVASEARCAAVLAKLTAAGGAATTTGGFDDVSLDDKIKTWGGDELTLRNLLRDIQGRVADIRTAHYGDPKQGSGDGGDSFGAYIFTDNPGTPQKRSIRIRDLFGELRNGAAQSARITAVEAKLDEVLALLKAKGGAA